MKTLGENSVSKEACSHQRESTGAGALAGYSTLFPPCAQALLCFQRTCPLSSRPLFEQRFTEHLQGAGRRARATQAVEEITPAPELLHKRREHIKQMWTQTTVSCWLQFVLWWMRWECTIGHQMWSSTRDVYERKVILKPPHGSDI